MWKKITTKNFWMRVAGSFLLYLVIYAVVTYALREKSEPFWTLKQMQNIFSFAFFMSVIFSFRQNEQVPAAGTNEERLRVKWSVKDFVVMYGLFLLFALVAMSALFISAWLLLHFVFHNQELFGKSYVRMVLVTVTMSFLAVLVFFLFDLFGIRLESRTSKR